MNSQSKPAWVQDAVFYQIFPDRFARSERLARPANVLAWHAPPTQEGYHGGDLWGIVERLDYLQELGINALYLTPVFQSPSNHRYHTHDYYQVDPLLGGNAAFRALVEAAHRRRMRVVLDGVFNHASRGFFQFNDILENGPHSPWLAWFHIQDWPLSPYDGRRKANYVSWADNRALPKFKTETPEVREFLIGVGEHWVREYDIDGWRLDVPTEIRTPGFWEEFCSRTRAVKPDLYLVGEIWQPAPDWLRGDRFDATMNYALAAAMIAFTGGRRVSEALVRSRSYDPFPGIDAAQFAERVQRLLATYDWETMLVQLNLLGSHDAPRVLSIARGDKATLRLATLLQMTFPGAPCVYYGDEIALRGTKRYDRPHRDLDARWPFPWHDTSRWDTDMLRYFQQLIRLRHAWPALRTGSLHQIHAEQGQYAFVRARDQTALLVAVNAAEQAATATLPVAAWLADGTELQPAFGPADACRVRDGSVTLHLPARTGILLRGSAG